MDDGNNNGGQDDLDSLFAGMELMTPSQIDVSSEETLNSQSQQETLTDNDPAVSITDTVSQPLDENLFSDLNLYSIGENPIHETPDLNRENHETHNVLGFELNAENNYNGPRKGSTSTSSSTRSVEAPGIKQASRKKKRSFKIGYGRADYVLDDGLQNNSDNYQNIPSVEAYTSSQGHADVDLQGLQVQSLPTQIEKSDSDVADRIDFAVHDKTLNSVEIETVRRASPEEVGSSIYDLEKEAGVKEEQRGDDGKHSELVVEANSIDSRDTTLQDSVQIEKQSIKNADSDATGQAEQLSSSVKAKSESTGQAEQATSRVKEAPELAADLPIEKKLDDIKGQISGKLKELHERAASISMSRKVAVQRRRQAAEDLSIASNKHKELEKELEEACEREDFEKAESLSESLQSAEKSKQEALDAFRSAEADCDSMALKMQQILESQVQIEEEGIRLLERLQKEAENIAADAIEKAEDSAEEEMEKLLVENEALELKKMEVDLELKIVEDADEKLKESIDDSVRDDMGKKKNLSSKRDTLMQELQDLLALVKAKEEEILENDIQIQEVEKRISGQTSKFEDERAVMKAKSEELMSVQGQLESKSEVLSMKKMEVEKSLASAEIRRGNLVKLAGDAKEEARVLQELVGLRKSIASSFLQSRESKARLAKKEQQISEELEDLRQQIAAARASLQELSSAKANLHQEITSMKQKILFIKKRGPELEAEKKVAAAARNFKEAGRVAAEAKKLSLEKETATINMEKACSDLQNLEEEIKGNVTALQEAETLVASKEREVAMARCERLRLVAASAREEWSGAVEVEDLEEAGNLFTEAEAADSEADKLQEACNFDGEQFMKISRQFISVAMASILAGKQLTEKSSCVQTNIE